MNYCSIFGWGKWSQPRVAVFIAQTKGQSHTQLEQDGSERLMKDETWSWAKAGYLPGCFHWGVSPRQILRTWSPRGIWRLHCQCMDLGGVDQPKWITMRTERIQQAYPFSTIEKDMNLNHRNITDRLTGSEALIIRKLAVKIGEVGSNDQIPGIVPGTSYSPNSHRHDLR